MANAASSKSVLKDKKINGIKDECENAAEVGVSTSVAFFVFYLRFSGGKYSGKES